MTGRYSAHDRSTGGDIRRCPAMTSGLRARLARRRPGCSARAQSPGSRFGVEGFDAKLLVAPSSKPGTLTWLRVGQRDLRGDVGPLGVAGRVDHAVRAQRLDLLGRVAKLGQHLDRV